MQSIRMWAASGYARWQAFVRRQAPYLILVAFLLAFLGVLLFDRMVVSIHPGELGVLWRRLGGGTQIDTVYREGLHLILPFNKMYVYNVRKQQLRDTISVLTMDGLTLKVQYSVRYFLEQDTLPLLHQRIGPDYVSVVVRPEVRSVIRVVIGQFKPEEIYATQKAIQERINQIAKTELEARFVALDDVPIENVMLPVRVSEAIESKLSLQQADAEYQYRQSIATKEADRRRIEADGIKVYNDVVGSSLTADLLSWQGILATQELAKSPNAKVVVIGSGAHGLPLILGKD